MSDFVLVHGAWHGAWCWQRLLEPLWAGGHRVFTVSLTGVGERAHQLSPDIRLATHIQDVQAVIEAEELQDVILVGHSYAGMVITGVADRLADKLAALIYLDAVIPLSGEAWSSRHAPETQAQRRTAIAQHGFIPAAPPSVLGLTGADAAWVERRQTPHPGGVYDDPLHFDAERWAGISRYFIDCTAPALPTIAIARERAREQPGWQVYEIATGHDAMVSAPDELLAILMTIAFKT
ncbi:alpha/beta hydrolase family protein [Pelomonas sp. SE-A7]|uniref:alpha/beta fold hydrolase n=1 Tax=Pelomonas sp. SE-A7 TaxID=3054953 RepID=UPI00259D1238|nr:alpha/beta hydrolase family protein [Pelomonas sp. SE-A7]MDM4767973.1 alpha/beta hydrolase family protein [Pelomonas sp. SE-A7]